MCRVNTIFFVASIAENFHESIYAVNCSFYFKCGWLLVHTLSYSYIYCYFTSWRIICKVCSVFDHIITHTHILWLSWTLSGTTRMSWHQKGKTNLDLLEQEIVSSSGISWAICKLHFDQDTWPCQHPTAQFFTGCMPFLLPNQQRENTEGKFDHIINLI